MNTLNTMLKNLDETYELVRVLKIQNLKKFLKVIICYLKKIQMNLKKYRELKRM